MAQQAFPRHLHAAKAAAKVAEEYQERPKRAIRPVDLQAKALEYDKPQWASSKRVGGHMRPAQHPAGVGAAAAGPPDGGMDGGDDGNDWSEDSDTSREGDVGGDDHPGDDDNGGGGGGDGGDGRRPHKRATTGACGRCGESDAPLLSCTGPGCPAIACVRCAGPRGGPPPTSFLCKGCSAGGYGRASGFPPDTGGTRPTPWVTSELTLGAAATPVAAVAAPAGGGNAASAAAAAEPPAPSAESCPGCAALRKERDAALRDARNLRSALAASVTRRAEDRDATRAAVRAFAASLPEDVVTVAENA